MGTAGESEMKFQSQQLESAENELLWSANKKKYGPVKSLGKGPYTKSQFPTYLGCSWLECMVRIFKFIELTPVIDK